MKFEEAKNILKEKYQTNSIANDVEIINVGAFDESVKEVFLALINYNGQAILTDKGRISENFDLDEVSLNILAKKNGLRVEEYNLETNFENINDIDKFINVFKKCNK